MIWTAIIKKEGGEYIYKVFNGSNDINTTWEAIQLMTASVEGGDVIALIKGRHQAFFWM